MDAVFEEPVFKQWACQKLISEQCKRQFTPTAHDLFDLSPGGELRFAANASPNRIRNLLGRSNRALAAVEDVGMDYVSPLIVIRFEVDEEDPPPGAPSPSNDEWSQLWPCFDSCCHQEDNAIDFVTRLHQADGHCHSSFSKSTISNESQVMECSRLSYSLVFLGKHILIVHHFHKINDEVKEMVRMVTCGYSKEYLGRVLCKALLFLNIKSSGSDGGSPSSAAPPTLIPHPIAIMCAMLECLEEWCMDELETNRRKIEQIETDIKYQRDPTTRIPKGLEISSLKLSDMSIQLGVVRQKLQYLLSSIASLEHKGGPPGGCERRTSMQQSQLTEIRSSDTPEGHHYHKWWHQLREVKARLMGLKGKSEQHNINMENLQERIKGILSSVAILLAERENEWNHQASDYQIRMMKFQVQILGAQELIASRTKRDNTVMKVIAVLTSLFLPGAFIATLFSMPVFNWTAEDPKGPHFMTYLYFTVPITGIFVIGFLAWFVKMWHDDKRDAKRQEEKVLNMERGLSDRKSKASLET